MSGIMKANPGSGRICHLIMSVFRGTLPPIVQEIFAASILYIILWHQQWTATTAEQCPDTALSTQQLQPRQVSKRLSTADHPRNAARNDVQV